MKTAIGIMLLFVLAIGCKSKPVKECVWADFEGCTILDAQKHAKSGLRWYPQRKDYLGKREALLTIVDLLDAKGIAKKPQALQSCSQYIEYATQMEKAQQAVRDAQAKDQKLTEDERKLKESPRLKEAQKLMSDAYQLRLKAAKAELADHNKAEAQKLEKQADELQKKAYQLDDTVAQNVPTHRENQEAYWKKGVTAFDFESLKLPIPGDLSGKACAYQAIVDELQYDESDTEGLLKKAKALTSSLTPDELKKLEIDAAWIDQSLRKIEATRARLKAGQAP